MISYHGYYCACARSWGFPCNSTYSNGITCHPHETVFDASAPRGRLAVLLLLYYQADHSTDPYLVLMLFILDYHKFFLVIVFTTTYAIAQDFSSRQERVQFEDASIGPHGKGAPWLLLQTGLVAGQI